MKARWAWGSACFFALATLTVSGCGGGGGDRDADVDHDADLGRDVDLGHDADGDADLDFDGDLPGDADEELPCGETTPPATEDWSRDILLTRLHVDLDEMSATVEITLAASTSTGASFEVGDLEISGVTASQSGVELNYIVEEGALHVGLPACGEPATFVVAYDYHLQRNFEGAMAGGDLTLTWPYYCGNLFPCHSDPTEGSRFELELVGVEGGRVAVYPETILADAPAYMVAWAVGDYLSLPLGTTVGGVELTAWYREDEADDVATGTEHLLEAFEWLETELGPYPFGREAGTVAVTWGAGAYGGMEHHPFWHISANAVDDESVQIHEAAHGWFGNGVRIACWEDFVLSEGSVSYLAARAIEAVVGPEASADLWREYRRRLDSAMAGSAPEVAWPDSCGEVDILEDELFSTIPYMKGAFFFRALEGRVGPEPLLAAFAEFFDEYQGQAATMAELLDVITAQTGYDPTACAEDWLREEAVPAEDTCP